MSDLQLQLVFETAEEATQKYTLEQLAELINGGQEKIGYGLRYSAIQVCQSGGYLTAAKAKVNHGGWLPWLADNCQEISQQAASNYMRLYEAYKENYQLIGNLTPTQAYKQLGIISNGKAHVSQATGENEWYTPSTIIELARSTMGSIDTDPASSYEANKIVQAEQYYTIKENGLGKKWLGNVWMNPPYAQPLIRQFSDVLVEKYMRREFQQACVLVNNASETEWFQNMERVAEGRCDITGRVKFIDKNGNASGAPLQGQAVLYFGNDFKTFVKYFKEIGICLSVVK